nr:hypothetical protein [Comamonas jiangduensis]
MHPYAAFSPMCTPSGRWWAGVGGVGVASVSMMEHLPWVDGTEE